MHNLHLRKQNIHLCNLSSMCKFGVPKRLTDSLLNHVVCIQSSAMSLSFLFCSTLKAQWIPNILKKIKDFRATKYVITFVLSVTFLCTGVTFASFHLSGNWPSLKEILKRLVSHLLILHDVCFKIVLLRLMGPFALVLSRDFKF